MMKMKIMMMMMMMMMMATKKVVYHLSGLCMPVQVLLLLQAARISSFVIPASQS